MHSDSLWQRIRTFELDDSSHKLTFSKRLARENGWSEPYAKRVVSEYKRFMFLAVAAGHPVTPSDQVDQAWHLHLTYTRSYWQDFCQRILEREVHHGPTKGGLVEGKKFACWYSQTKASYRRFFGGLPPEDIWPSHSVRFGDDLHYRRVNARHNWIIPRPRRPTNMVLMPALGVTFASGALLASGALDAVVFVATVLAGAGVIGALVWLLLRGSRGRGPLGGACGAIWWGDHKQRDPSSDTHDGSDSGGCGSGCASGCGGGCGGCGGCGG